MNLIENIAALMRERSAAYPPITANSHGGGDYNRGSPDHPSPHPGAVLSSDC